MTNLDRAQDRHERDAFRLYDEQEDSVETDENPYDEYDPYDHHEREAERDADMAASSLK